jgi:general stress protein YciG
MGFEKWDKEKIRQAAQKGGRAVAAKGNGHRFTTETARAAGSKGGKAVHAKRRAEKEETTT